MTLAISFETNEIAYIDLQQPIIITCSKSDKTIRT